MSRSAAVSGPGHDPGSPRYAEQIMIDEKQISESPEGSLI